MEKFPGHKGFEIAMDVRRHILRLRLWGIWDVTLARKYKYALAAKMTELRQGNGGRWYSVADFTAFYPLSEDVQNMIREYLEVAKTEGMKKIVYLGEKTAMEARLDRIFQKENGAQYLFAESEEKALQWLLGET